MPGAGIESAQRVPIAKNRNVSAAREDLQPPEGGSGHTSQRGCAWGESAKSGYGSAKNTAHRIMKQGRVPNRTHCVTATDPTLVQSPLRAGLKIDAYQMEPLRKALRFPSGLKRTR